ncbi:MAG: hypothetical protein PHG14_16290 [Desulfobacter postgatei]|uniref:hypothetical protein n=1 Tax=Desulfobacter postgatei TaxID=2293 RepID=UPI0023F195C8|nr:hypothetical protein [Desulfobacter postgatei]MDD4275271.1 hypothetical protein [Desulfobacter postgatei]
MARNIISAFFYIIGGFFVYMICLLSFISIPKVGLFKFAIVAGFSIPALIFLFTGAALRHFQNWKSSVGIALLSGVSFNLLVIITFICILLTPELKTFDSSNSLSYFSDYVSGFGLMLVLAGLGGFLLKKSKIKIAEQGNTADRGPLARSG